MEQKQNLKTGLMGLASGLSLIVCFCFISLVNASDEGLVAYYSFDEGKGNVLQDSSGNGNDGTIYGAKWVDGKYGKALEFDGINDYVDCEHVSSLNFDNNANFTVEVWLKRMGANLYQGVVTKNNYPGCTGANVYGWTVGWRGDYNKFFILVGNGGYTYIYSDNTYTDSNWHHVVLRRGSGITRMFVDGVLQSESTYNSLAKNTLSLDIGSCYSTCPAIQTFNGIIDEVRIYNRALTESEIKADMVSSSPEMMKKVIQDTISKTQTKIDQLKKENINTGIIEKVITSAEDALQKEAYKTALEQAQDASSKADKVWNAFQSYNSIKKEVDAKVDQLKREGIDTSIIEKSLSEAKSAFGNENFELAQQIVSDASSKADKSWNTYQYIETAKNAVKEAKGINCDASKVEKRINDAVDALNKGSYDTARQYASDAVSLAEKANCGNPSIKDLKALSVKYDGRTVEVSGKVRDIETVYGRGYKFTVDDGTGLITVGYDGSMKDVNNGDTVNVEGVFSKYSDAIIAEKVEKSGLLGGGSIGGDSGDGIPIWLIIGIAGIIIVVAALFILKKNKGGERGRRDVGERI